MFLFLRAPSIDATNWRAEQAIRPAVVTRKVCGGNRTRKGADTQQLPSSVARTARQRDLDLPAEIATMLRSAVPVVPEAFGLPRGRREAARRVPPTRRAVTRGNGNQKKDPVAT